MTLNRKLAAWPYPAVVAHRGGGALAPENTLAAFRTGARLGHRMVEFDAKLSRDDVSFLLHDDSVDRTSNGHGAAAALSYSELEQLDAGSWFAAEFAGEPMPTLEAVAHACRDLTLAVNVEIKPCPERERATGAARGAGRIALLARRRACAATVVILLRRFGGRPGGRPGFIAWPAVQCLAHRLASAGPGARMYFHSRRSSPTHGCPGRRNPQRGVSLDGVHGQ